MRPTVMIADPARLAASVVDEAGLCFFPLKARKGVPRRLKMFAGDYRSAEALNQRALAIREKAPRPNSTLLARNLNNLASIYVFMGKYG